MSIFQSDSSAQIRRVMRGAGQVFRNHPCVSHFLCPPLQKIGRTKQFSRRRLESQQYRLTKAFCRDAWQVIGWRLPAAVLDAGDKITWRMEPPTAHPPRGLGPSLPTSPAWSPCNMLQYPLPSQPVLIGASLKRIGYSHRRKSVI